jgi:hypothetical protein
MELPNLDKHNLRLSPYWALAGGKLRQALGCLPADGVNKRYPVFDSGQGSAADTLIIGAISPEKITLEQGELSLATLTYWYFTLYDYHSPNRLIKLNYEI